MSKADLNLPIWHWIDAVSSDEGKSDVASSLEVDTSLGVSIIIPAKNEEPTIGPVIDGAIKVADEVIVVDGHSVDNTRSIAKSHGAIVIQDGGKGKGDGMRAGAQVASNKLVVFIDADGSHDPADVPALIWPIQAGIADLVVGSRGRGGSDELHGDMEKLLRQVGSDILLIGINWRFNSHLTDSQNGFRAIRKTVLLDLGLRENITTIEQEMTMKALKKGYVVVEIPTHEYERHSGNSTIKLSRVWFRYIYSFLINLF